MSLTYLLNAIRAANGVSFEAPRQAATVTSASRDPQPETGDEPATAVAAGKSASPLLLPVERASPGKRRTAA